MEPCPLSPSSDLPLTCCSVQCLLRMDCAEKALDYKDLCISHMDVMISIVCLVKECPLHFYSVIFFANIWPIYIKLKVTRTLRSTEMFPCHDQPVTCACSLTKALVLRDAALSHFLSSCIRKRERDTDSVASDLEERNLIC